MHQIPFGARSRALLLLCALAVQGGLAARPSRALQAIVALAPVVAATIPPMPEPASAATPAPAAPSPEPAPTPAPPPPPVETAPSLPPADIVVVPPSRAGLRPVLEKAAKDHGLPTDVMMAQAWAESSWRDRAMSHAGAAGVLQLTPDTVEFVSRRLLKLDHQLDPFDPAANARMGARYMRHLLDRTGGDWRQALIAYNQGLTALRRNGPYAEAVTYADRVLALRSQFGQS